MSEGDALAEGEPLPDAEVWLRELTNTTHVRDGRVHYQALKGSAIGPPEQESAWSYELSGRARSRAGDLVEHGEATVARVREARLQAGAPVPSKLQFVGVAFARASEIRCDNRPAGLDAIFTPNEDDAAHADLVAYGDLSDEELQEVRDWLQEHLHVALADEIDKVDAT